MKVGMRSPSIKKSVKARTTGRVSRAAKKSVNPLYGKKGMGYVKDPERAVKNSIYHKTTAGLSDMDVDEFEDPGLPAWLLVLILVAIIVGIIFVIKYWETVKTIAIALLLLPVLLLIVKIKK